MTRRPVPAERLRAYGIALLLAGAVLAGVAVPLVADRLSTPPVDPERPCVSEQGPAPCRWDSKRDGDGTGRSYTITPEGDLIYDDQAVKPA